MTDRPWWRDPYGFPPRATRATAEFFTPTLRNDRYRAFNVACAVTGLVFPPVILALSFWLDMPYAVVGVVGGLLPMLVIVMAGEVLRRRGWFHEPKASA